MANFIGALAKVICRKSRDLWPNGSYRSTAGIERTYAHLNSYTQVSNRLSIASCITTNSPELLTGYTE
jgi:hypothetical protein